MMSTNAVFTTVSLAVLLALLVPAAVEGRVDYDIAGSAVALVAIDLNADSALDIAAADQSSGAVAILFNNGDGKFGTPMDIPTAPGTNSIVAARFTPWSFGDLAVTNGGGNSISVLYSLGDGTFDSVQTFSTLDNPRSIVAGDFYEDGCTDLAYIGGQVATSSLCLLFNDNM
jgi:hypothetical protein